LAFARAVQEDSRLDVADLEIIAEEKRLLIQRSGVLQYSSQAEGLDHVGGYRALKAWLAQRREGFSPAARQYGLSEPRGLFLLGVPGCGKSLSAKAIAQSWRLPLLHLDVGALFSKFIGETEANLRLALRTAEAAAPAVLWADEVEKGFAGASGAAHSDAGTSARMFATFLVWMQERARPVFVVATANNVSSLPPEFLRKGRFDEVFFLDLPALGEREEIVRIHLRKRARDPARFEVELLARESEGYSGAEIESAIVEAMYQGFTQKREFTTSDIREAIKKTVPLARTQLEAIQALRAWARDRARQAS
jgi:SpoVK/Ycf46/Vps4 family AAA+-type ATPase